MSILFKKACLHVSSELEQVMMIENNGPTITEKSLD